MKCLRAYIRLLIDAERIETRLMENEKYLQESILSVICQIAVFAAVI